MKLTLSQRIQIALLGYAFSHNEVLVAGAEPTPFYIAKCRIHGYYTDYPHGFEKKRRCPECEAERR